MSDWRTSLSAPTCPSTPLLSQISCYDPWSSSRLPDVQRNQSEPISSREPPKTPPSKDEWTGGSRCAGEYCLYANRAFGGERGIVVITTAHGLEKVKAIAGRAAAKTLEDEGDSHSSLPSGPSPFYVEEVSGKGLGMLASRALRRGDVVLTRVPALLAHRNFMERTPREERERLLGLVLSLLPAATRRSFVRQAGRFGGHEVADIVTTNSFQVDLGGDGTGSSAGHHYANFPEVSRFNHDCRPNAVFFVDADLVHRTTVVRDVAPGEELTISYLDSMAPRAERQHRARVAWGFECTCAQCGLTDETAVAASDGRLAEIAELEGRLSDVKSEVTLDTVDRYVRLFAEEKLEAKLAGAYTTAALNYNLLGKSGLAVKYARLAIEAGMIEDGPAAPDVEAMRVLARDPKKHFTWRARLGK
ncbi:SET domain-containing protein [Sodiomyces alkalinus F11]|uniref:SET domain-containing protein n=1 Tax=Sodiomyces alkalinus (strain CBS 110278 / VKM F-3762 / F11) TaxID=1314773 RepID=A0A3N2PN16_SODAK|nr:SET domain-containing protein [Sodiomyces alkalinus F11]ROT35736.1 SET domain-containing protein [Sodiomyces alkalinus F11]